MLPGPEPPGLLNNFEYRAAIELFPECSAVVVIGYSFAGGEDDVESLAFFSDLLKKHPKRVVAVGLQAEFVASLIQERVRSKEVYPANVDWSVFSHSVCRLASERRQEGTLIEFREQICAAYRGRVEDANRKSETSPKYGEMHRM